MTDERKLDDVKCFCCGRPTGGMLVEVGIPEPLYYRLMERAEKSETSLEELIQWACALLLEKKTKKLEPAAE